MRDRFYNDRIASLECVGWALGLIAVVALAGLILPYSLYRIIRMRRVEPPDGRWSPLEAALGHKFRGR